VRPHAAGLDAHAQRQLAAHQRHAATVAEVHPRPVLLRALVAAAGALDPVLLLGDERRHLAQRHPARHDDLDPVAIHDYAGAARAVGAADRVWDPRIAVGGAHASEDNPPSGRRPSRTSSYTPARPSISAGHE
jgi:hypothetical protein